MKRMKLLFTLALPVLALQNSYAQTASRLIAKADWHNNGAIFVPTDTSAYYYNGNYGGDLTHTMMDYRDTTWVFNGAVFVNSVSSLQSINMGTSLIDDHTWQTWDTAGGGQWRNTTKAIYTHNSTNDLIQKLNQVWGSSNWVNTSKNDYSYFNFGGVNKMTTDLYSVYTASVANPVSVKNYSYSGASGNLIQEVDQTYISTVPTNTAKYDYSYDTGLLSTTTYSVWNGATWVNNYKYTYSYDGSRNRITSLYQTWNTTTGAWVNVMLKNYTTFNVYSTGAPAMPSVETDQVWDTTAGGFWKNSILYNYTYNSFSQLQTSVGESWNTAGLWEYANGDPAANYYYQTYTTSAVVDVKNEAGVANVFPVPAQGVLNINLSWKEAQASTITLLDMSGRVVKQISTPISTQYNTVMPVENVAAGSYVVRISGTNGQIVKQVVIAH